MNYLLWWKDIIKLEFHHPFATLVLILIAVLFLYNVKGYIQKTLSFKTFHRRPQEYLPYLAAVAEIIHLYRGC